MNRAAKGRSNEHRSMSVLKKRGYYPIRSAGSHGLIDVIGVYCGDQPSLYPQVLMVQSKTGGGYSERSISSIRMLVSKIQQNANKVLSELSTKLSPTDLLEIQTMITPICELHDWEKFQRYPSVTIINTDRDEDISL